MRLIHLSIPQGKRRVVLDLLDERGIDYAVTEETGSSAYDAVVTFPVPTNAVESILDALQAEGLDEDSHAMVLEAETVISDQYDDLEEEYATKTVEEEQISRQELISRAGELTPTFSVFMTMTVISSLVATAGLLLDSPAVVVGSMVIAPLIGPALAASIGTVVNDREMFLTGMRYQFAGVVAGIVSAALFAWLLQTLLIVPPGTDITQIDEIAERIVPELLLVPVALGAGVAGVLSLATGFSVALVGVMIAAALIPPMAAAGIALAWGLPTAAVGSTMLVFVNLMGVNLAGLATLWYIGYRPGSWFEIPETRRHLVKMAAIFVVVVLALSISLASVTYTSYQVSTFEQTAIEETEAVLAEHESLELLSLEVQIQREGPPLRTTFDATEQIDLVVIEVGGPPDAYDRELIETLHARINEQASTEVTIQVRFVTSGRQ